MRRICAVFCLLLTAYCLLPSLASAGLGGRFIKPEDTLDARSGVIPETPAAPYVARPLDKLNRGVANVFTSLLEWPVTIRDTQRDHGWFRAIAVGPIHGTGRLLLRLGSGIVDVATFPLPLPHRALWVRSQSLLMEETDRAAWVIDEARTTQQELSRPPTTSTTIP